MTYKISKEVQMGSMEKNTISNEVQIGSL